MIKELKYDEQSPALLPEEIMILKRLLNHEGILKMSKGTKRNRKFHIVQGPLVDMDDYIIKYDSQHKLATLNLFFINQQWQAGVMEI
ncbi:MAG: hypothetical protein KBT48_00075 [Firmicutes bacterium]|nr:hypothetical protein [Bacillota bacterium]